MNPVVTAYVGDNSDLFLNALELYVKAGANILDMTWGKGTFWKKVATDQYHLVRNDIDPERGDCHYDFRHTPFLDTSFDCVILDPPYASRSSNKNSLIGKTYNNDKHQLNTVKDMIQFYWDGMWEAYRLLKKGGILFVKCMDEVTGGGQARNHISVWKDSKKLEFIDEDLFVLVNPKTPIMRHKYQLHARKNNSFLWVFRK